MPTKKKTPTAPKPSPAPVVHVRVEYSGTAKLVCAHGEKRWTWTQYKPAQLIPADAWEAIKKGNPVIRRRLKVGDLREV